MKLKHNVMWNTVGTLYYLGMQWLTTVLVVRISGSYEDAGIYSLAVSITNIFYIIAMYNVRNFQVSDYKSEFIDVEYIWHRFSTMIISFLSCCIFTLATYHESYTVLVINGYMLLKLCESFVDVLHGIDQKADRIDVVGKSFLIRGTVLIATFFVMEILSGNILLTTLVMASSTLIVALGFDVRQSRKIAENIFSFDLIRKNKIKTLYAKCFPLLIYGVSMNAIASIPRVYIEKIQGKEILGYYASVATPAVIVQALANVIFVPFINVFTDYFEKGNSKKFYKLMLNMILLCVALGVFAYVFAYYLGEVLLADIIFHDESIRPYCYLLSSTLVCSALVAIIWFLAMLLVIDRSKVTLIGASLIGVVFELLVGYVLVRQCGVDGINISLMITYLIVIAIMLSSCIFRFVKHFRHLQAK